MAGNFTAASSQYLSSPSNGIATQGYPAMVGAWVRLASTGTQRTFWSMQNGTDGNNYIAVGVDSSQNPIMHARSSTLTSTASSGAALTTGAMNWAFILVRFITNNNRKMGVLLHNGTIVHASSTTSKTSSGILTASIGARVATSAPTELWDGQIANIWWTTRDVQADGAQIDSALLRKLAFGGPFSVPSISDSVLEYLPMTGGNPINGNYYRIARPVWTNNGGVTSGEPCPFANNWIPPKSGSGLVLV